MTYDAIRVERSSVDIGALIRASAILALIFALAGCTGDRLRQSAAPSLILAV
jgi:hypothetical protein